MRRSSLSAGNSLLSAYIPCEDNKMSQFTAFNQFPYTLEQEVVSKMAPINKTDDTFSPPPFSPILDDLHEAAPIGYTGVI
jgi:hypothetical protein